MGGLFKLEGSKIKIINKAKFVNLKVKILFLTVVPLICATAIITYLGLTSAKELAREELRIYENNLIKVKKEALKDQVDLAFSAIQSTLENPSLDEETAKEQVKQILDKLTYGDEGYFFAYTQDGTNLVHPIQPNFVGQNLWSFEDSSGNLLIQHLLKAAAKDGGGFHRYIWEKPSSMRQEEKLSYVSQIERWNWMFGTGLYLDDIYAELAKADATINENIRESFFTVLAIIAATIILVILLSLAINLHEHKLADDRLKALVKRFVRLQVSERRKFSRDLHDGINQLLVSCKFRIELAKNTLIKAHDTKKVEAHLNTAEEVITQSIQEIRQISHNLRPTALDDLGLKTALNSLLDQFEERTNIKVKKFIQFDENSVSDEAEITLYRLAQECLSNIEKHAQANKVSFHLTLFNQRIEFECIDNGIGFSQNKQEIKSKRQGIGLINMKERIELIGGDYNCRSQPKRGTKITATLESNILK
ncbi:cache domain-containing protein [Marinomonas sp. PE14-40]|uniref:cache domain-containing protein n=1 Tax=Marinomonas sp. PE14-40 TaxID=3060621 RepID=UPI003F667891